jgi:hypothetical protein
MTPRHASSFALLDQCLAHLDNMENLLVRGADEQVREMITLRTELTCIIALLKTIGEEENAARFYCEVRVDGHHCAAKVNRGLGLGARLLARADDTTWAIVRLELASIIALLKPMIGRSG